MTNTPDQDRHTFSASALSFDDLQASLAAPAPPSSLSPPLQALWWDAKGDWDAAHACVQDENGPDAAWVHAYLHRKEGDPGNAGYWYRRAGRPAADGPFETEWAGIAHALVKGVTPQRS